VANYEATFRTDTILLVEKIIATSITEAFTKARVIAKDQGWFLMSVKFMGS